MRKTMNENEINYLPLDLLCRRLVLVLLLLRSSRFGQSLLLLPVFTGSDVPLNHAVIFNLLLRVTLPLHRLGPNKSVDFAVPLASATAPWDIPTVVVYEILLAVHARAFDAVRVIKVDIISRHALADRLSIQRRRNCG